jgi:hypothetical protein
VIPMGKSLVATEEAGQAGSSGGVAAVAAVHRAGGTDTISQVRWLRLVVVWAQAAVQPRTIGRRLAGSLIGRLNGSRSQYAARAGGPQHVSLRGLVDHIPIAANYWLGAGCQPSRDDDNFPTNPASRPEAVGCLLVLPGSQNIKQGMP